MTDAGQRAVAVLLPEDRDDLRALVLDTPPAGRGPVDASSADDVRVRLRAAVSALARWTETAPAPSPATPVKRQRTVVIPPGTTLGQLGRRTRVELLAGPLDAMALAFWQQRVAAGSGIRWRRLWDRMAARDELAPGLDVAAVARHWSDRLGAERVTVRFGDLGRPDPTRLDLSRRLNQVLAVRPPQARAAVASLPWPAADDRALGVPAHRLRWASDRAARLADDLAALDCRTVGDPRLVVPSTSPDVRRSVPAEDALDLAVRVLSALPRTDRAQWEEGRRG